MSNYKDIAQAAVPASDKAKPKAWKRALPYLMVLPSIALLAAFVLYPIGYMIYLSLFKWNMIGPMVYTGLGNFETLFSDPDFYQVMGNTFQFMFFQVLFSLIIALLMAAYLKADTKANAILQSFSFTPYIVSMISVAFIWMWLMDSDFGLLNFFLGALGMSPVRWLEDPKIAMFSLIMVSVWKSVGYNTIILISAMQAIPGHLYEAAKLDKGRKAKIFFKLTLPMISPTLFFLTLMNIIAALKVFETVNVMTYGGPINSTATLVFDIYQYGFSFYKIGYASALGVVLMGAIGICTALYFAALSKRVHYR